MSSQYKKILVPMELVHPACECRYFFENDAGFDFVANIEEGILLEPNSQVIIPVGVKMAIPPGYELQVRPRSGLAAKHGLTVTNSPGTIDSGYTGEIRVILFNLGTHPYLIQPYSKIAQGVLSPINKAEFLIVEKLEDTLRGSGGFGSTGV